ncbi:MAG: 2-oxoacid:acceptor oxidoreductase family protein [Candidatus Limnocylindrales bacterium]
MERSVVFAGFGGQGLLFAGQVLAQAAVLDGRETFWIPSYGPEMRGGTASCTVIVSDHLIGSPEVDAADAAVVMNPPSLARFAPLVAPGGLLVINDTLIEALSGRADVTELRIRCTELAREAGDDRLVSVVALGALVGRLQPVDPEAVREAIRRIVGKKRPAALEADLAAFEAGLRAGTAEASPIRPPVPEGAPV